MNEAERLEKTKLCCDPQHKGVNPLPISEFYRAKTTSGVQNYCKRCSVRRVTEYRAKKGYEPTRETYLERHERRRAEELAIAESFNQPIQENFCFVERKPMFRGLADGFLRQETKRSSWRAA